MVRIVKIRLAVRRLRSIHAVLAALVALCPAPVGADTGELDAAAPTLDTGSEERDQDSAFAESYVPDMNQPDLPQREQCGAGPPCTPCQNCIDGACVDLPVACTLDSDCADFHFCFVNKAMACNNACKLKPGKCVQNSDCAQFCAQCQSNTCADLYSGTCGPSAPCPDGSYCDWNELTCVRTCKPVLASDVTTGDGGADAAKPNDEDDAVADATLSDATSTDGGGDTKPDSTGTLPPMAPAPDPGCGAGRSYPGLSWLWLVALVVGWRAGQNRVRRTCYGSADS